MNTAQRLRAIAKRTALDGIGEELMAIAEELDAPSAGSDAEYLAIAESVGLIGPRSRWGDTHNAVVRFGRALTQALATTEPVKPLFATKVAAQKWAELQKQGHRMQTIWFDGGPGGAGTIDPWGKVTWSKAEPTTTEAVCACGDRPASQCDEEWGPQCDLGNNAKYARPATTEPNALTKLHDETHDWNDRIARLNRPATPTTTMPAPTERKGEPGQNERECPHCEFTGSVHCGDVADKISATGGHPKDCSNAKIYGLRAVNPLYTSPQVPEDVMSVLSAIHRRPSDAGIWLDDLTRIIRAARKGEKQA